MSLGDMGATDLGTFRGRDYPTIRQFSIFTENKLGALAAIMRLVEEAKLTLCALSVHDQTECSLVRLVVAQPERCYEVLEQAGHKFCEVDLVVVELPNRVQPVLAISSTLLGAEIDISYCYPLMVRPYGRPAIGFKVDDIETATQVLDKAGFIVLTERDLDS